MGATGIEVLTPGGRDASIPWTQPGSRGGAIQRVDSKRQRFDAGAWLLLALLAGAGCGKQALHGTVIPNLRPTVQLTQVPAPADTSGTYAYEVSWAGYDPDGRVAFFEYSVDPPSRALAETVWVMTTANRKTFVFRSDSLASGSAQRARGFHTVVVRCQDEQGARSPLAAASFTSTTMAPGVQILVPSPSTLLARAVPAVVRIEWQGIDPDGIGSQKPASYRWKLFGPSSEFTPTQALADPDSVRRFYAPAFAGWDSVGGDVQAASLHDLVQGQTYMFVVVAFDQAGAYSPVFSGDSNMLLFRVDPALSLGPQITIGSPAFTYTFPSGGYYTDPDFYVRVEFPADLPIQLFWSAKPAPGGFIRGYRWAVDILRLDDETPRTDEATDLGHWSRSTTDPGIVLPADSPGAGGATTHYFYLEAEDDLDLRSLAVVQFTVVRASFDKELLVVDDTWFTPDRVGTAGCVTSALGQWPSAAELDTFLYAAGDKPYRCYPAGARSPAGVFAGYSLDTLGTHFTTAASFNLRRLDRYRNIIWMTDLNSAFAYTGPYNTFFRPMPLLRALSAPAVANPLSTWLLQGGRLWLMGGGSAYSTLINFDAPRSPDNIFSAALGELGPGRLMYDNAHWKSEVRVLHSFRARRSARAVGAWAGAPDYTLLPETLFEKSIATDPLPPLRTGTFYLTSYAAEHLFKPNSVLEHLAGEPPGTPASSVLDTLYETQSGEAGSGWPLMTVYHGREASLFVFTGFPIWYFQRSQTIELVDFVLGRLWGLSRQPIAR